MDVGGGTACDVVVNEWGYLLRHFGGLAMYVVHENAEHFHAFIERGAVLQFADREGELVECIGLFVGNGAIDTILAQQLLREAGNDVVHVLGQQRGHVHGTALDAVPVLFAYPVVEGTAWNAEQIGYLGL